MLFFPPPDPNPLLLPPLFGVPEALAVAVEPLVVVAVSSIPKYRCPGISKDEDDEAGRDEEPEEIRR